MLLGVCDKDRAGSAAQSRFRSVISQPFLSLPAHAERAVKQATRPAYAQTAMRRQGKVKASALFDTEMAAYPPEGTCYVYGTANSNQLLLDVRWDSCCRVQPSFQPQDAHRRFALPPQQHVSLRS